MSEKLKLGELHEGFIRSSVEFDEISDIVAVGLDMTFILYQLKINGAFNRKLGEILDENINSNET